MKNQNRLNRDYFAAVDKYGEKNVLGVFAYNDDKYTTIQTECIIIPTLEQVCLNEPLINTSLEVGRHILRIKDIRLTYHATREGHTEMIKSLYTDEYIVNPRFSNFLENILIPNREKIALGAEIGKPAKELKDSIVRIMTASFSDNAPRMKFLKKITDAEKVALSEIINEINCEGDISQAKIAIASGVSRLTVTNLISKMRDCGIAEIQYLGVKGTHIKILDASILDMKG